MRSALVPLLPLGLFAVACSKDAPVSPDAATTEPSAIAAPTAHPVGARPVEAATGSLEVESRIAGALVVGDHVLDTLTELTDRFGPRVTGSEVHRGAAAWAVERFRASGVDAALETFTLEHAWSRGTASGKLVAPREQPLHVASFGWASGTPTGGVHGDVVKIDDFGRSALAAHRTDLAGKIVYVPRGAYYDAWDRHPAQKLFDLGAAAVLVSNLKASNVTDTVMCEGNGGGPCTGPTFKLGLEDSATIERLLEKGPVAVELTSTAALEGPAVVPNVVAEIRGRERPGEVVMVGAHLDSWDFATGAQDNGSGCAQVLEAARAIRAGGAIPRRTLRFALWAGEEQGSFGARAYLAGHAGELDRFVAYLNTDNGAGAPVGWVASGKRDDVVAAMKPMTKTLLSGLGATSVKSDLDCDSDGCPFWLQGVPSLDLDVDGSEYRAAHHLPADTVDKVKPGALAAGAAVVAVTAYELAERPESLAPRVSHAAVARALKGDPMVPALVEAKMWRP